MRAVAAEHFDGLDVVFFAGRGAPGGGVQWGRVATEAGAWVIDNGGDFRMDRDYPLIVPEVNMDAVNTGNRHICSPNCSTIQMVVAIAPIPAVGIKRIVVSTYQSVSGWGLAAMNEFERQVRQYARASRLSSTRTSSTSPSSSTASRALTLSWRTECQGRDEDGQ